MQLRMAQRDYQRKHTSCEYQSLGELRHQLRLFLRFSEQAARPVGLNPRQHQLMLALKGLPPHIRPSVGELAKRLQVRHHSTVELANRLVRVGSYAANEVRTPILREEEKRRKQLTHEITLEGYEGRQHSQSPFQFPGGPD